MEIRFRTAFDQDIQVGELLVIEDGKGPRKYLVRIMDVEYGADSDEDGWTEREAGTAVHKDSMAEDFDPNSMRDRLTE